MAETIAEEHPELAVSARGLRRILTDDGIAPVRTRRPPRHRSRRERRPRAGLLLQADGSKLAEANVVLARYLPRSDARFGVPPRIEAEFCFNYRRMVSRDATIPWDGQTLAVPRRRDRRSWSGRRVTVEEHLDGSLWVRDGKEHHRLSEAPLLRARSISRAGPIEAPSERPASDEPRPLSAATKAASSRRPAADHPWRRYGGRSDR